MNIENIQKQIEPLRQKLLNHSLYSKINRIEDLRVFTKNHVYAVWDFMSLLKSLQVILTCTKTPWMPNKNSETAYLINEIVLAEETDINQKGVRKSHYELYLDAMKDIGASTEESSKNIFKLSQSNDIDKCIQDLDIHPNIKEFLHFTFSVIKEGKAHKIAAIFTFGRENLIPNMFNEILHEFEKNIKDSNIGKLIYYFERHIELDEDEHGPMALDMVSKLAGDKAKFWLEIEEISKIALRKRILLWDAIEDLLENNSSWSDSRNSKHETYSYNFSDK